MVFTKHSYTVAVADDIDRCGYCGFYNQPDTAECEKCGAPLRRAARLEQRETISTRMVHAAADTTWPVVGIDVSQWQGTVDWSKAKPLISFAFIRAGIGNDVTDTQFMRNVNECQRLNIPHGLYWYIKPDKDWRRTAASFATAYNSYGGPLPPVFDVEDNGNLSKAALESWLLKCVNEFERLTNKPVMIYTAPGFWNGAMPITNWAKNRLLWVAHWTTAAQPLLPLEWTNITNPRTWTFWQHSADGNGLGATYGAQSASIDLDRFNGSIAEFNTRFGVDVTPPAPPPDPVIPPARVPLYQVRITAATLLNVRAQPSLTGADIGDLYRSSVLPVYGEFDVWLDCGAGWIHRDYTTRI
jgi:lysozyme